MSPRGDHLPPQDADDSVKPLQVVRKQLVSISTPHLQKHRRFISTNLHRLDAVSVTFHVVQRFNFNEKTEQHMSNIPSSFKNVSLTLFMSSDIISLGWAVLESSVTSTVSKEDTREEMYIILYLVTLSVNNIVFVCFAYLHTPVPSSSLQRTFQNVVKTLIQ